MSGTAGGTIDDAGIFLGDGTLTTQIVRKNQVASGGQTLTRLGPISLNDAGQVVFGGSFGDGSIFDPNTGIFRDDGGSIATIATTSSGLAGFATVGSSRGINSSGTAVFRGIRNSGSSEQILLANNAGVIPIVSEFQQAPDGNGVFVSFDIGGDVPSSSVLDRKVLNDSGQVAFYAELGITSGGGQTGIFRADGGGIVTQIARRSQSAPDGNGTFDVFGNGIDKTPSINEFGSVAFLARLAGTTGGTTDNRGIFVGNGGVLTQVVRTGINVPDGNGIITNFRNPELYNQGQVAFAGTITGSIGGTGNGLGVFRGSGSALTQISRPGQAAPDGNGVLVGSGLGLAINDVGQTVFTGSFTGTSGGALDNQAILTGDGIDFLQVARFGDSLGGSSIISLSAVEAGGSEQIALNQKGQVAYDATLADGRNVVERWTPDLHWRSPSSGKWDTQGTWTLGLDPADVHDVYIEPDSSLVVTGSLSDKSLRSLTVGGGSGEATLSLAGSELAVDESISIATNGILAGNGQLNGDTFVEGTISPGNSAGFTGFQGDLDLSSTALLEIELGGLASSQFDHLNVFENLMLDGDLQVSLINGFELSFGNEFLILDVFGNASGNFQGLGEGALVGNFGGRDLFITYEAGNGNDVALFSSSVPEPSAGVLIGLFAIAFGTNRRRRKG